MTSKTFSARTCAALARSALMLAAATCMATAGAQGLRPEVGKPLQEASQLLKAGKAKEALAKVREAEHVSNRTPAEELTIERMKVAAAQRAGDAGAAIEALQYLYGKTSGAEKGQIAEQLAATYAQQRNNNKATEWLNKAIEDGNNSASVKQMQSYLRSASGDYAAIAKAAGAAVAAAEQAGRRPEEGDLLRLADAQQRTGNVNAYVNTLEKLLFAYPKKDYWSAFLGRLPRRPNFSDRLGIDVMRLRLATGTLTKTDDYMELAQLSLQAGLPAEAQHVMELGYKAGALGTGAEAARQQRLRALADKKAAEQKANIERLASEAEGSKTGDDLVHVGHAYVTMGDETKGIELIKKGIAKGGLKYPEDAKLRLGLALLQSGKAKSAASQTLRSVKGNDGVADIARLWLVAGAS